MVRLAFAQPYCQNIFYNICLEYEGGNADDVVNAGEEMSWNDRLNGGWQVQLGRVRRWYHRASRATDPIDRADCIHAFFESAFHLRRWLEDTGQVSRIALLTLCETNEEMRICRDLGNAQARYAFRGAGQFEIHEYSPGAGNLSADVSLVILRDGQKHDAFELAKRLLERWEGFAPWEHGIPGPRADAARAGA